MCTRDPAVPIPENREFPSIFWVGIPISRNREFIFYREFPFPIPDFFPKKSGIFGNTRYLALKKEEELAPLPSKFFKIFACGAKNGRNLVTWSYIILKIFACGADKEEVCGISEYLYRLMNLKNIVRN